MRLPRVIIVGGGPAGCAAANALATKSIEVQIIERGKPGKEKACGDAFVSSALQSLDQFNLNTEYLKKLGGYFCNKIEMYIYDILVHEVEHEKSEIVVLPRKIVDQKIRNYVAKSGRILYNSCVMDIALERNDGFKISVKSGGKTFRYVSCDAVILASGSNNRLARRFGIDGSPYKTLAISTYVNIKHNGVMKFQFVDSCEPGYRWIFPISDTMANVGVCVLTDKPQKNLRILGDELLEDHNIRLSNKWRGGFGLIWSGLGNSWHHPAGIVSCGDTAGLINPYSGEGITAALISGQRAGNAVADYLKEDRNTEKLQQYSEWITNNFHDRYKLTPSSQTWCNLCGLHIQ